jgi:hypothetical protein
LTREGNGTNQPGDGLFKLHADDKPAILLYVVGDHIALQLCYLQLHALDMHQTLPERYGAASESARVA